MAQKLAQALQPLKLEIINESHRHVGHAGDDGSGESHFFVNIVSDMFIDKSRVERHRMVHDILKDEMMGRIHALSFKALTIDEYARM